MKDANETISEFLSNHPWLRNKQATEALLGKRLVGRFGDIMTYNAIVLRVIRCRKESPGATAVRVVLKENGKRVEKLAYLNKGKYYIP